MQLLFKKLLTLGSSFRKSGDNPVSPGWRGSPKTLLTLAGALAGAVPLLSAADPEAGMPEIEAAGADQVNISYRGVIGQEVTLEKSTDLVDSWMVLATETPDASRVVTFSDAVEGDAQFYRVVSAPLEIPLVYEVEHTGAHYDAPPLPEFEDLPVIVPLTDPFEWSDGSGRIGNFADWSRRRAEIKAELEEYEIGLKPPRPENITASFSNGTLTVDVTENGQTLTLTSQINLPSGEGPFPAVIGMGFGGSGSLPGDIFTSRDIAMIPFNFAQVMQHSQQRGEGRTIEPINRLYPELVHMGAYSAWSWGVSRLIDGLELVQDELPVDLSRLAVTGCSFAGKMALWAGALDERIALTITQEPGGGGAAAWRVSQTLPGVENLGATNRSWFMESMWRFAGENVSKLPTDHHELMAMVAPRALLFLGNADQVWLAEESGYVSARAAHEVWKAFGIEDRFGFAIARGFAHCALPAFQRTRVEAFVDKFLLGIEDVDTSITVHPYDDVNYKRWFQWWGTGEPVFPRDGTTTLAFEPECGVIGENWEVKEDPDASNGAYIVVKEGFESIRSRVDDIPENVVTFTINLEEAGEFDTYWRLNLPDNDSNSFWIKVGDAERFILMSGVATDGWEWRSWRSFELAAGEHKVTIGYRSPGAMLDKVIISNYPFPPEGLGEEAEVLCTP